MIEIQTQELINALGPAYKLAKTKTNVAITQCVLLSVEDSELKIYATNLTASYGGKVDCSVSKKFTALVDCIKLLALLSNCPDTIILSKKEKSLNIKHGRSSTNLQLYIEENFPNVREILQIDTSEGLVLPSSVFIKGFKYLSSLLGDDDTRPYTKLINIKSTNGAISLTATNGFNLANFIEPINLVPFSIDVHKDVIPYISSILRNNTDVFITKKDNFVVVTSSGMSIAYLKSSISFVDVSKVFIDSSFDILVDKEEFRSVLSRLRVFADEKTPTANFSFYGSHLEASVESQDGNSEEAIGYKSGSRHIEEFKTNFRITQLMFACDFIPDSTIAIRISDNRYQLSDINNNFKFVLTPVKVS